VVVLAAFYLWRVGREYWQQPKMVALFGVLVILAAAVARLPGLIARDRVELGFLRPAALLGYLAASLFDSRTAVVMAIPVAAFTALAAESAPLVIFAAGATLAPIPLVSAVSSRAQLNLAVALSAALHAPLAVAVAWFFYGGDSLPWAAGFGTASGLISGVAALGLLPFLSSLFKITTTQTLLDLTDRNHPALRLLEEQAPGSFNHSLMVGSLAGKAARAVGGNPLLAQAMAYYHDLGKTVSPQYYAENQFGVSNPHDSLPPEQSAAVVRSHVAEGLRLSREYGIPADVGQAIVTHHGTSLMRYFFHKAIELYGDDEVEPGDYRHRGRKPRSKEMVVVMMSDSCEAAARALVQNEDPTSESLRNLVEQIIAEKVEDGQLEESQVTFGELTRIKETIVDGLIGYYHARIPYPGFPGRSAPAS
jgi:putative nucleotidyltransferase with HDIG domain